MIWDTLKGIANSALEGFKRMFGIHSPSTVFEGFGENIDEGLIGGLENKQSGIEKAMDKIKEISDDSFDNYDFELKNINKEDYMDRIKNINNSIMNKTTNNTSNIYFNVDKFINDRKQKVQGIAEELGFYNRRQMKAKGAEG